VGSPDESHFQQSLAYSAFCQNLGDKAFIAGMQFAERLGLIVRHILNSSSSLRQMPPLAGKRV
jgi:hypothetical protein